jgi:hypothetical protein
MPITMGIVLSAPTPVKLIPLLSRVVLLGDTQQRCRSSYRLASPDVIKMSEEKRRKE